MIKQKIGLMGKGMTHPFDKITIPRMCKPFHDLHGFERYYNEIRDETNRSIEFRLNYNKS